MLDSTQQAEDVFGRLTALYEAEVARNTTPTTTSDVPLSYDAVSDRWLTTVLCQNHPDAQVTGHDFAAADDGTTNRNKLTVRYNDAGQRAGLPDRIFCKASFGLANRFALGPVGAIEAEVNFYNHVRDHLEIVAPRGVFAVVNEAYNSLIMLRDISSEVSEFCDHTTVMTRARAESQVRLLASVHAAGASNPEIVAAHSRFRSWYDFFHGTKSFGLDLGAQAGFAAASDLIPAATHRREAEVWSATEEAVARSSRRERTFTHGDVHLKNWYVNGDGQMGLSDWQCATVGHWGRDLAYALGTALTIEDRRTWEKDLVGLYIDELGRRGGKTTSFDETFDIYREQMLPALAWWTITLNPAPGMPEMQPRETAREFVNRLGTAIDDLGSLDARPSSG